MKLLWKVGPLLLLAITSHALDLTYQDSNIVSDLQYRPKMGTFTGRSGINFDSIESEVILKSTSTKSNDYETTALTFSQELGYAITDTFDFGAVLSYEISNELETTTVSSSAVTTEEQSGLKDPEFFAGLRVLDQNDMLMNLDFLVNLSPSIMNAELRNATADGNSSRGGGKYTLGASLGQKFKTFSWSAGLSYIMTEERDFEDPTSGTDVLTIDSGSKFEIALAAQLFLAPHFALEGGIEYLMGDDEVQTSKPSGIITTYESASDFTIIGKGHLLMMKNMLALSPYFKYTLQGDRDLTVVSTQSSEQERTTLSFGAEFSFAL